MDRPHGAFAPVPTPLDGALEFDPRAQKNHLEWLASEGLDGALVLGTNGEFPSLSLEERKVVAESAAASGADLQLMLGIGSSALPEVLSMLRTAADLGYGSVLCPPPFYFRAAPLAGLIAFFGEILERSRLPVLLYHIPQVTGVPISDELLDGLDGKQNLVGVKDSTGDPEELKRLTARFKSGIYMVGHDRLVTKCIEAGGTGSISAAASVEPALVCSVQRGEAPQSRLDGVRALLEEHGLGPSVKEILRRRGLGEYATRPPLMPIEAHRGEMLWDRYRELVTDAE